MSKQVMPAHLKLPLLQLNNGGGLKKGESALHGMHILPSQCSNRLSITSLLFWQKFWENPPAEAIYIALENDTTIEGMRQSIADYIDNLRIIK